MLYIVHFSYVPNTASCNRLLAYLANVPREVRVKVFFLRPDSKSSRIPYDYENIEVEYCWEKFGTRFNVFKYYLLHKSLRYIRGMLKENDIVYCYNIPSYMKQFFKVGVKVYGEKTEHPLVTAPPSRFLRERIEDHIKLCKKLDGIFVISTALRDYYVSNGVAKEKVHIINMIVDSQRFQNIERRNPMRKYIAYCGNASNNKDGVDKLIRSFSIVNKICPEIYLYVIGPVSLSYSQDNINLAKELGVLDKIIFTGVVSSELVPQILKEAQVLALNRPNSLQAQCGFATKLGEYLLTSNPVVLTDVGDITLFLKDGYSALISSPDNDNEFADKIIWALNHREEALKIGQRGYEVALSKFNAEDEVKKMLKIILS